MFRDQADFCVLIIYDADNIFEHYSIKYLPDFNVSGMVLNFSLSYQNLQPIDSAKYSWINWSQLDVSKSNGEPLQVPLWDYATLASGTYSVAQGTYTITAPGGCSIYDRLTLFVNNASFDFVAGGGESASYVAETFANSINTYNWSTFENNSICSDGLGRHGRPSHPEERAHGIGKRQWRHRHMGQRHEIPWHCVRLDHFPWRRGIYSRLGYEPDGLDAYNCGKSGKQHRLSRGIRRSRRQRCSGLHGRSAWQSESRC